MTCRHTNGSITDGSVSGLVDAGSWVTGPDHNLAVAWPRHGQLGGTGTEGTRVQDTGSPGTSDPGPLAKGQPWS